MAAVSNHVILTAVILALVALLLLAIVLSCKVASWKQYDFPPPGETEGTYVDVYGYKPNNSNIRKISREETSSAAPPQVFLNWRHNQCAAI